MQTAGEEERIFDQVVVEVVVDQLPELGGYVR